MLVFKLLTLGFTDVLMPSILLQDDMIDDVDAFVKVAEVLKERGAYKVYVMATHGLLSSEAPRLLEESSIDEVNKIFWFCH